MSSAGYRSIFNRIALLAAVVTTGCNAPLTVSSGTDVSFMVVDVGQGLSQFIVSGNEAILVDVGPPDADDKWFAAYNSIGRPLIRAIIISHRDSDHSGGLEWIDESIAWSGTLIASSREDTALLRARCIRWLQPIAISSVEQGDTISLINSCTLDCLWPPSPGVNDIVPVSEDSTNFYSIVCRARNGNCSVLMTGDIDSTGARAIAIQYGIQLRSDIVVVPHHGSAGSACPLFYGYIRPSYAALSFGTGNSYGHPSAEILTMLARQGIQFLSTMGAGSIVWSSNGYYWTSRF